MLDSCSTDTLSYENQFFRFDFTYIHVYVFRLSFLTTLNIYKDYILRAIMRLLHLLLQVYCDWRQFALVNLSLKKAAVFVRRRV